MILKSFILLVITMGLLLNGVQAAPAPAPAANMPGSLTTTVTGSGTTAGSLAQTTRDNLALPVAIADQPFVTQNIFVLATVPAGQTGSASVETTQTTQTRTINRLGTVGAVGSTGAAAAGDPVYSLNAQLSGTAHADVTVTTAGASANFASAQIFSDARTAAFAAAGPTPTTAVNGQALLDSSLHLDGAANGLASASGTASYDATASGVVVPAVGTAATDTEVAGQVAGTTKIQGSSVAGGTVSGLTHGGLAGFYAGAVGAANGFGTIPATAVQAASSHLEANSRSPTLAALGAAIVPPAQPNYQVQTISSSNADARRGLISSGKTQAYGSVEGSANSVANTQNALGTVQLLGQASQSAVKEDIGAETEYILDRAVGYTRVYSEVNSLGLVADQLYSYGEAVEYARAHRSTTGNDLDYGWGNVQSAEWTADLSTTLAGAILPGHNDPSVSVSGSNGFVAGVLSGFRASATLANRDATDSTTFTRAATSAAYVAAALPANVYQTDIIYRIDTNAPFSPSALQDAAGGWNALKSANVESTDSVRTVSTSVANWNGVKWIQGMDSSSTSGYTTPAVLSDPVFQNPGASATTKPADGPGTDPNGRFNNFDGSTTQRAPA